jgi:hypothetical protein
MSTPDIWMHDERLTRLQAARALNDTAGPPITIHSTHGDKITIYRAYHARGAIQPPAMNCSSHGGGAQEARRYAALMSFAAEIMELAEELDAEAAEAELASA